MNFFGGIDPGATGAIAFMREDGKFAHVRDYPGDPGSLWNMLTTIPKEYSIPLVVLEKVSSMPGQGVSSTFKFGTNFGIWQMACSAMGWSTELVAPMRWRKILDSAVPQKPTKDDLRIYTCRRWPEAVEFLTRKKDHGRSEAILMSEYARQRFQGRMG